MGSTCCKLSPVFRLLVDIDNNRDRSESWPEHLLMKLEALYNIRCWMTLNRDLNSASILYSERTDPVQFKIASVNCRQTDRYAKKMRISNLQHTKTNDSNHHSEQASL